MFFITSPTSYLARVSSPYTRISIPTKTCFSPYYSVNTAHMDTFVPSFSGKKGTGKSGKGDQYKEWDKLQISFIKQTAQILQQHQAESGTALDKLTLTPKLREKLDQCLQTLIKDSSVTQPQAFLNTVISKAFKQAKQTLQSNEHAMRQVTTTAQSQADFEERLAIAEKETRSKKLTAADIADI